MLNPILRLVMALAVCATSVSQGLAATCVVFRYDDLAADPPGFREKDQQRKGVWDAEVALDKAFEQFQMPYVVGIIPALRHVGPAGSDENMPFSVDKEKVEFVKKALQAGRMQVAMHGFTHENYSSPTARASEFDRPYPLQHQDLISGSAILKSSLSLENITTFIPPFNQWNNDTARALVRCGFTTLSADSYCYGPAADRLTVIPFTAQLWDLETMLNKGALSDDSVVVVLFHPAQIAHLKGEESRYFGVDRIEKLLAKLATMPNVRVVTFQQLERERQDLTPGRYAASFQVWRWRSFWEKILPSKLLPAATREYVYLPESEYQRESRIWAAISMVVMLLIGGMGALAYWWLQALVPRKLHPIMQSGAGICVVVGVLLLLDIARRHFHLTALRVFPLCFVTGFTIFSFKKWIFSRHRRPDKPGVDKPEPAIVVEL